MQKIDVFTPFQQKVVRAIVSIVCSYFNQPENIISNKRRTKNIVIPKQYCIYFIKDVVPDVKLTDLATFFGFNHATIIYALKVVKNNAMVDSDAKKEMLELHNLVSKKYLALVMENNGHILPEEITEKEKIFIKRKFTIVGEAMWYDLKLGDVVTKDDFMSYFNFMIENN